jgi:GT2 family glycosyltransferase
MANVSVSIIVPTGRPEKASRTLYSVASQKTDISYEILASGKGSTQLSLLEIPNLEILESSHRLNPAQARNLAAKQAKGDYLFFVDDDCETPPNWIEANLAALQEDPRIGVVSGIVRGASEKYLSVCVDYTIFWAQQGNQRESRQWLYSATLGVRRKCFEEVGGFDEDLRVGEDVVFSLKAFQQGYACIFDPRIIVIHHHGRDSMLKFLKYLYDSGSNSVEYVSKYQLKHNLDKFGVKAMLWSSFNRTRHVVMSNRRIRPAVLLYTPGIFLGYLVYHLGLMRGVKMGSPKTF